MSSNRKNVAIFVILLSTARKKKARKRYWVKDWLVKRQTLSHMSLVRELRISATDDLKNYLRMDDNCFKELLKLLAPYISKKNTKMRRCISAEERLIATLRFLATGRNFEDLKFTTFISPQALGVIIPETCKYIYKVLQKEYVKFPRTADEWKEIARNFESRWNFPNCGGAIDGKHIRIFKPPNSGPYYFNYKGYHSVVLMAIVNSEYEFLYVNVGCNGRVSDGGVIEATGFYEKLMEHKLDLVCNNDTRENMNFVVVADDAFPLHENILKPFPQKDLTEEQRIFNYRLSRARRVVENAFGILANRFRVFHTAIMMHPQKIDNIVLASCALHNFLRRHAGISYIPKNYVDTEIPDAGEVVPGNWRREQTLDGLRLGYGRNPSKEAKENRELYKNYFMDKGKVPWQNNFL